MPCPGVPDFEEDGQSVLRNSPVDAAVSNYLKKKEDAPRDRERDGICPPVDTSSDQGMEWRDRDVLQRVRCMHNRPEAQLRKLRLI